MLYVALRRFRHDATAIAIALAGVGLLALITGRSMNREYRNSGLASCLAAQSQSQCRDLVDQFGEKFNALQFLIVPLVLLPALLGAFIGAPLVARELEAGTHRFLWTQGVTRQRWFAYTSGVALGAALIAGSLYALIAGAWLDTTNTVTGERLSQLYDFQGIVPIAASVFAVAVGVASGVAIRRTVPAMAATLGIFIAVRVSTAILLRPRFAAVKTIEVPFRFGPVLDDPLLNGGAWVLSTKMLDASGKQIGHNESINIDDFVGRCPNIQSGATDSLPNPGDVNRCLNDLGAHTMFRYHPGDRFWTFQLIESALLLGLAGVAIAVGVTTLNRRTA